MKIIHHHFTLIDSTNTWAKLHCEEFDPAVMTLISADAQTAGRGRFARSWVSPPNHNIYASYCVFLENGRSDIGNLPQVAAVSIAQTLMALGFQPKLKWPNDVIFGSKKVAGILSESTPCSSGLCLIIGIGLNINMPVELLRTIDRPATSLFAETNREFLVSEVLSLLTKQFSENTSIFIKEGFSPFLLLYRSMLQVPLDPVQFDDNRAIWSGAVHSVNDDGSLNLILSDNTLRRFHAGEIIP